MRTAPEILNALEERLDWRAKYGGATSENPDMVLIMEGVAWLMKWVAEFDDIPVDSKDKE